MKQTQRFLSLLRGINVSGHKIIKMTALKALYEELGFSEVVTYIQSGNVVFTSQKKTPAILKGLIESKIQIVFGFSVEVLVLTKADLEKVIENDPFSCDTITSRYVTFLSSPLLVINDKDVEKMKDVSEKLHVTPTVIYLCCPNGYGKTKLSNTYFEKKLLLACTTRNWKTVLALAGLLS